MHKHLTPGAIDFQREVYCLHWEGLSILIPERPATKDALIHHIRHWKLELRKNMVVPAHHLSFIVAF